MLRRGLIALGAGAVIASGAAALSQGPAQADPVHAVGNMTATQNTFAHTLTVHGWAYAPNKRNVSVMVRVYGDGHYLGRALTDEYSAATNKRLHLHGRHVFTLTLHNVTKKLKQVKASSYGYLTHQHRSHLATRAVHHYYPGAASRVVTVAKEYVGSRYHWGGDSPRTGFDCSGLVRYVYQKADVRTLPHQSESIRHVHGMHATHAPKPGDIAFYMSGGDAYHVSIYMGHDRQVSAATTATGVVYNHVHGSNVQFGTVLH